MQSKQSLLCNQQVLTWKHIDMRLTMVGYKMKNYTFKFPTLPSWLLFRFGLILCQYLEHMTRLKSLQNAQPISSAATLSPTATDITNPKRDSTINALKYESKNPITSVKLKLFWKHLSLWQISCRIHYRKLFVAAGHTLTFCCQLLLTIPN